MLTANQVYQIVIFLLATYGVVVLALVADVINDHFKARRHGFRR